MNARPDVTGKKFGTRRELATYLSQNGFPTSFSKRNCPGWATAGFGEKILSTEETGSDSSIG